MQDDHSGERKHRETFLALREHLGRALDGLREVRRHLEERAVADERAQLFVDVVVAQRRALEDAVDRGMHEIDSEWLDEFVQYGVDPTVALCARPGDGSSQALARWQTDVDEGLSASLLELSTRLRSPDAKEVVAGVVRLIRAHDRRVARELQELRDV